MLKPDKIFLTIGQTQLMKQFNFSCAILL